MPNAWPRWTIWLFCLIWFGGVVTGCVAPQLYSYIIYENPTTYVRLEYSPWVDPTLPQTGNDHPAKLSPEQMQRALTGLRVREHRAGPVLWFLGQADPEPVFREEEITLLVPLLLDGLELAVPRELVTFYVSHPVNATKREVTSGGMYVKAGHLHVLVSNYRTNYEIPPAGLIYDRRYPLFSLAPHGVDLLYETEEMVIPKEEKLWEAFLGKDQSEIVLDLSRLSRVSI